MMEVDQIRVEVYCQWIVESTEVETHAFNYKTQRNTEA